MLLMQHMLVDGVGHGIGFWHRNLNMLNNLDGIWFLDFNRIWLLHRIGYFTFRYFGNYLIDRHLNLLLDGNMNRIRLWYMQLNNIGHLYNINIMLLITDRRYSRYYYALLELQLDVEWAGVSSR